MNDIEKYIYEIYKTRSISKAAVNLFISQPSLSSSVKRYEKQLGYDIFDRKSYPLTLTKKGFLYIEYLEEKFSLERRLEENIKRSDYEAYKKIRINSNNSSAIYTLPLLCKEFTKLYPEANIEISITHGRRILYENVEKGIADIALDSNNPFSTLEKLKLWEEKYVFLIRKDYEGIEKVIDKALSYEELRSGNFPKEKKIKDWSFLKRINLFMTMQNTNFVDEINNIFKDIIEKKIRITKFYRMDLQYSMVKNGLGAMLIPQSVILNKGYDENELCCFGIDIPENKREMYLYYNKNNNSEYVREFIKTAEKMYEKKHFLPEMY